MKKFKSFLAEGITPSGLPKAASLITTYLKKKLGVDMFNFTEAENFKSSSGSGYGIRFFIPAGNRSFRLNWTSSSSVGSSSIESVDVWLDDPKAYHLAIDSGASLAQTLPLIADMLQGKFASGFTPTDDVDLNESTASMAHMIIEANNADPSAVFDHIIQMAKGGTLKKYGPGSVWELYAKTGQRIFNELQGMYPNAIVKTSAGFRWAGNDEIARKMESQKNDILSTIGCKKTTVSRSSGTETYVDKNVDKIEDNIERLSYENQIKDLEHLIKMTVGGSANALFVAGRGGIGKTHTVEKVLASLGLKDNAGYFKNTGSASAAGIYALLFKHKDGIVLFDDSDDALGDQEARNIFKAATDTKKIRKIVWNKMGKNIVDPDGDLSDEEILDQGLLPRYFEFTGKIIFISNLGMNKLDPDGAIRTRAFLIDINPTDEEVFDFMEKIVDDVPLQDGLKLDHTARIKVVKLLRSGTSKQTANLRKLSRGLSMAAAGGEGLTESDLKRMISAYA